MTLRQAHTIEMPIDTDFIKQSIASQKGTNHTPIEMIHPLLLVDGKPVAEDAQISFAVTIDHTPDSIAQKRSRISRGPNNPLGINQSGMTSVGFENAMAKDRDE